MVLVLLLNMEGRPDAVERANPGSKIFEYAGAHRHILALGPPHNVVRDVLSDSGLGYFASDESGCIAAIRALHERYLQRAFAVAPKPTDWFITPREMARRFAGLLDRVVAQKEVAEGEKTTVASA